MVPFLSTSPIGWISYIALVIFAVYIVGRYIADGVEETLYESGDDNDACPCEFCGSSPCELDEDYFGSDDEDDEPESFEDFDVDGGIKRLERFVNRPENRS